MSAVGGIMMNPILGPKLFPFMWNHGPIDWASLRLMGLVFVGMVVGSLVIAWLIDRNS